MGLEYTHKKFNYGYSHNKLRQRVRQCGQENNEKANETSLEQEKKCKSSKNLFRPYAVDENNTTRERKISSLDEQIHLPIYNLYYLQQRQQQQQIPLNISSTITTPHSSATGTSPLSHNSHNIHLQRQRDELYMRYIAQIQEHYAAFTLQTATAYYMGYPGVATPKFQW